MVAGIGTREGYHAREKKDIEGEKKNIQEGGEERCIDDLKKGGGRTRWGKKRSLELIETRREEFI